MRFYLTSISKAINTIYTHKGKLSPRYRSGGWSRGKFKLKINTKHKSGLVIGLLVVFSFVLLPGSFVTAIPLVQEIYPSGDPSGHTDWMAIQEAFDAATGVLDAIIRLHAGTYYIDQAVVIKDFVGTFIGAGNDQTTIRTPGGNYLFPTVPNGPVWDAPGLFIFYYEDLGEAHTPTHITVSDMTWHALGQTEEWQTHVPFLIDQFAYLGVMFGRVTGIDDTEISYVSASVERMQFLGEPYPEAPILGWNVLNSFVVEPEFFTIPGTYPPEYYFQKRLQGTYTCTDTVTQDIAFGFGGISTVDSTTTMERNTCKDMYNGLQWGTSANLHATFTANSFENVLFGIWCGDLSDSHVLIGGLPSAQNTFTNGRTGVELVNLDATYVEVSHCETFDCSGVYIEQTNWGLAPSYYTIEHNTIRQAPGAWWAGVEVWSYGPYFGQENIGELNIAHNTIITESYNFPYGPIFCFGTHNTHITNNLIKGTGIIGIFIAGPSTNCYIRGNNLKHYTEWYSDIYLDYDTNYCTVVVGATDTIVDDGVNNTILGE